MVDYSSQKKESRRGTHATTLGSRHFRRFLLESRPIDMDIMLEIRDKERSALTALGIARNDPRLVHGTPQEDPG